MVNTNEILTAALLGTGTATGGIGLVALVRGWALSRQRISDRESEVEIAGREADLRSRISLVEEQRRTVARVADTQERLVGTIEIMAGGYSAIAAHGAAVNDRLDRIEDALQIRRGSAAPMPPLPPLPRAPTASRADVPDAPQPPQR